MTIVRFRFAHHWRGAARGFALSLVMALTICVGAVSFSGQTFAGEQRVCFDDWSAGAATVKEHGLVSVAELSARAKSKIDGRIVKTTLCKTGGEFVYVTVVRFANGSLKSLRIDARDPFSKRSRILRTR